jgi:hypothetical protein
MVVDVLANGKDRELGVHRVQRRLKELDCSFLIAAQDRDVALAAMVSFQARLPLVFFDQETQDLNITSGMWGKNGVLVADRIENMREVEPTVRKVIATGGKVRYAVVLAEPTRQTEIDLGKLGITVELATQI